MDDVFLNSIRCLIDQTPLRILDSQTLAAANRLAEQGLLKDRSGETVEMMDAALINESGSLIYVVENCIPRMIAEHAVPTDQLDRPSKSS